MGYCDFFEETSRIQIYNVYNHGPITSRKLLDFGEVFPLPSYEDDQESKGMRSDDVIVSLSVLYATHVKLKKSICSKIIFSVPNEIKTTDFYSVHRRGTDHSMHTEVVTAQNFIDLMSNHFELYKNKTIYIATDDDEFIGVLRATYPELNLIYQNSERGQTGIPLGIHFNPGTSEDRFRRGLEILTDIYAMARSKGLLCGTSGIPCIVKVINPALPLTKIVEKPWS